MSSLDLLTPMGGRLVQGSLYEPQDKDILGNPLTTKFGPQAGQPRVAYYLGVAIPKGPERHWSETEWGAKIWQTGHADFPAQAASSSFAWKIVDGDSVEPNKAGKVPRDKPGFPGHWVLNFSSSFPPTICNRDGSAHILDKDAVNLGDYVQVAGNVAGNGSQQQPGVFLNPKCVALSAYGPRIVLSIDPKSLGFGSGTLPPTATDTPPSALTPPTHSPSPVTPTAAVVTPATAPPPPTAVAPHPGILSPAAPPPPPPVALARVMLPAANGASYESYRASGWTDELLIQHGMMQA